MLLFVGFLCLEVAFVILTDLPTLIASGNFSITEITRSK